MATLGLSTFHAESAPKKVLVIHSFGGAAPPFTTHSVAFETVLTEEMGERVDLDEVSLDVARYPELDIQEAFVEYMHKRQARWQPDLVVPIGSPAGVFVAQFRERLFPETPILYCGMDQRRLPSGSLEKNAVFVGEKFDLPGMVDDMLQLVPATTNIAVVIGASDLEQYWAATFRKEFQPFTNRVGFTWLNTLSYDQMLDRVSKLPPRSFIFLILLLRDATGVTHDADEALKRIHAVANAPVNGIFQNQLGLGIVGGRLYPAELEGAEAARIAIRLLRGESASNFPPKTVGPLAPMYDWRELQRWNISHDRLPPSSLIKFREPTMWERYRTWFISGISVCVAQGVLISMLVANLVRRRRAEQSLRKSEERMQLAAGAAKLDLWEWDMGADRVWVADRTPARPNRRTANGEYHRFLKAVHPEDRDGVALAVAKSLNADGHYDHVHRTILPDGQIRWIATRGRVEFDAAHKPMRMRGVSLDITERKQAEDRAQESEREFLLIANSAPVLIWTSGTDKLCNFFNQPWLEFTGRTLEQELGNGWTEGVHPDDLEPCLKTYTESFDARRPFTMEYRLRRRDGQYRWVSDHGVPRYDARKAFAGFIGSCVDLTERKASEAEALHSRQELAHVSRVVTLGELTGSLAHELNQPLTAILSNAQAAQRFLRGGHTDELDEILTDIVEEGRRAGDVVARVRAMLKKTRSQMLPHDLNLVAGEVLDILHSDLTIRRVAFATRLAPGLPRVEGDRVQLQQVLLNLILNACEAMNETPVDQRRLTIETRLIEEGAVQVSVADSGTGFTPQGLEHIFEPFQTTKPDGLGLGLPICRSIINAHGGRLWAVNNADRGATLSFALPGLKEPGP